MKKILSLALLASIAAGSQAVVIYDSMTGVTSVSYTSGLPRNMIGEGFSTIAAASGQVWKVTSIDFAFIVGAAGTYNNVSVTTSFWNDWNPSAATGSVFTNQAGDSVIWNFGDITVTGATVYNVSLDFEANGLSFFLQDGQDMGFIADWKVNGVANDNFTMALVDAAPSVGTSGNGFYRDVNNNGILEQSDARSITGWTNTNVVMRVNAEAVPEPATMAVLGLGAAALIRRRRK
jgi:hypothetical protein